MGKRNRNKKKRRKKYVKLDDYFSFGPLELARFGEITVLRNNMNSKLFEKMQTKYAERFPKVCREIDHKIDEIVNEVRKYSPTELMKRAYWEMASNNLGIKNETEVDKKASMSLRMVDYTQSIIASSQPSTEDEEELTEEKWDSFKTMICDLFEQLNLEYQLCRKAYNRKENPDFDIDFEDYYSKAQIFWCNVRGQRYLYHETKHFQDTLTPHSDVLKELFGITAEQLLEELSKIQYALSKGMIDTMRELEEFQRKTMDAFEKRFVNTETFTEDSMPELMSKIIRENGWEQWQQQIFGRFNGLDLFDLEKVTNLPHAFLEELSWSPGQDVDFFSEGDFRGWPLRIWPVFKRPFLKLNGHYYCFELYN